MGASVQKAKCMEGRSELLAEGSGICSHYGILAYVALLYVI